MTTRIQATTKVTKYTIGLDQFSLSLLSGVNGLFNEHSSTKVSKSLLMRKAIHDYTGRLLTANDPQVITKELDAIRAMS